MNKDAVADQFMVGDPVKAKYPDGKWYPATIAEVRDVPIYVIDWEDKSPKDRYKVESEIKSKNGMDVGAHVKAQYHDGKKYKATISKIVHETSYIIDWKDKSSKDRVKLRKHLKPSGGLSDPICVVIGSTPTRGEKELGRTEFIMNDLNPKFEKSIGMKVLPDEEQTLTFKIYDLDAQKGTTVRPPSLLPNSVSQNHQQIEPLFVVDANRFIPSTSTVPAVSAISSYPFAPSPPPSAARC
jgi:hypothetical protein